MKFERDSICVDGGYVATELFGEKILQDDDGDLWVIRPVDRVDVVAAGDES